MRVLRQDFDLEKGEDCREEEAFSVEQMVGVLKQAEVGILVKERMRQVEISEQTFYRWKKRYEKLEVDPVRQLKQLREENARLKRLAVAGVPHRRASQNSVC